jgi:ankyrin repeat protein
MTSADLFAAIRSADEVAVGRLLDETPDLARSHDPDGLSAVMLARYFSFARTAILERVIAARGETDLDIFEAAATGRTARLVALLAEDPGLARGWSVDGFTALHLASFFGAESAAEALLEAGADPDVESRNDMRVHPLHSAVAGRAFGIARLLVDAGADVDAVQAGGFRPLHAAAQNGDELTVDLLLLAGARAWAATDDGRVAADFATAEGHERLADRLQAAAHGG